MEGVVGGIDVASVEVPRTSGTVSGEARAMPKTIVTVR
jgi:hypothetical protein